MPMELKKKTVGPTQFDSILDVVAVKVREKEEESKELESKEKEETMPRKEAKADSILLHLERPCKSDRRKFRSQLFEAQRRKRTSGDESCSRDDRDRIHQDLSTAWPIRVSHESHVRNDSLSSSSFAKKISTRHAGESRFIDRRGDPA